MILEVVETFEGRGGSTAETFEERYNRVFLVITDDIRANGVTEVGDVKAAVDPNDGTAIPQIGDQHPEATLLGARAVATEVDAQQQTDCPDKWVVRVRYTTLPNPSDVNPLLREAQIAWDVSLIQIAAQTGTYLPGAGLDGNEETNKPVVNSAGDPYDPPVMIDEPRIVLRVTKNLERFPREQLRTHVNHVNKDAWYGFPVGTVKLNGIAAPNWQIENGIFFWPCTYEFHVKYFGPVAKQNWLYQILDAGMNEMRNGKKVPILKDGLQVSSPWPLDGSGVRLDDIYTNATPFRYRWYKFYDSVNFSGAGGLGLDNLRL